MDEPIRCNGCKTLKKGIAGLALTATLVVAVAPSALVAAPKGGQLGEVTCDCTCAGGGSTEGKTYKAPNGDPTQCGKLDDTNCSRGDPPKKLENCSGFASKPTTRPKTPPITTPGLKN